MSWDVDASGKAGGFVDYLDTFGGVAGAEDIRRTLLASLGPQPGDAWLDVGCGIGDDAILLAPMVSPGGRVVAVDASATMIAECRLRIPGDAPIETHVADAQALPFVADTFDGVFANRVLQHVPNPAAAVGEILRVARPGATVSLVDTDWDTYAVEPSVPGIGRLIESFRSAGVANPRVGRDLAGLLEARGAHDVVVLPLDWTVRDYGVANVLHRLEETAANAAAAGAVTRGAAEEWVTALRTAARDGLFAARVTISIARARKP